MKFFLFLFFLDAPQLIFSGEYTKAMSKDWHLGHFSCWQCDESLTGQRYVLRDEHPYCVKCYETVFANTCDDCNRIIGIDSKVRKTLGRIQQQLIYTIANRRRKLLVGHMSQPKTRTYYSDRLFFSFFMVHLGFVVQGSPLARGLFLVQQVPVVAGRQAIRLQG